MYREVIQIEPINCLVAIQVTLTVSHVESVAAAVNDEHGDTCGSTCHGHFWELLVELSVQLEKGLIHQDF
jgi:6-pyruvoyl-tetrahydropterin synthase